jgi:hypothetical protein
VREEFEMNKLLLALMLSLGVVIVSTPAMARRGADDNISGHVHQCRGCDDPPGHVRGGEHADGHVRGGHGADDEPKHQ